MTSETGLSKAALLYVATVVSWRCHVTLDEIRLKLQMDAMSAFVAAEDGSYDVIDDLAAAAALTLAQRALGLAIVEADVGSSIAEQEQIEQLIQERLTSYADQGREAAHQRVDDLVPESLRGRIVP